MRRAVAAALVAAMPASWSGAAADETARLAQAKDGAAERPAAGCPSPLRNGCEGQRGSCQIACPPQWSTNPAAPAFTPNDRAGCLRACFSRYLSCLQLYGCM